MAPRLSDEFVDPWNRPFIPTIGVLLDCMYMSKCNDETQNSQLSMTSKDEEMIIDPSITIGPILISYFLHFVTIHPGTLRVWAKIHKVIVT